MVKNEKQRKIIGSIIGITIFVICILSLTYAYYIWKSDNTNINIGVHDGGIKYVYSRNNILTSNTLSPVLDYNDNNYYQNNNKLLYTDYTATNTKSDTYKMILKLNIKELSDTLKDPSFKWVLLEKSSTNYSKVVTEGDFSNLNKGSNTLNKGVEILPGESHEYRFIIYIDGNMSNSVNLINGKIDSYLELTDKKVSDILYEIIKIDSVPDNIKSEYVSSSTGIDFSQNSSDDNGKGVYQLSSTSKNSYPIYYYRGNVQDNNVKFANFCWKIVRTTETGGVKLIYNGSPNNNGGCTNTKGDTTQLTETKFNSNNSSPADVGYMYGVRYDHKTKDMSSDTTNYMYGKTVSYEGKTYTLETTKKGIWSNLWNGGLNSNHYTCFTESNICNTIYYIYYTNSSTAYYIELIDGKKVEDVLREMTSESTNDHDSTIKEYIDSWYKDNMTEYTNYLEDTVWCNDRSIGELNGWNPDGGNTRNYLYFSPRVRTETQKSPKLTCSNDNDKFTVNNDNGNGKLTYPVGLLTGDEINYAGASWDNNSNYYLYTNKHWWSMSPSVFYDYGTSDLFVNGIGLLNSYDVYNTSGIRPSISLKPGTKIVKGNGSQSTPFEI